MALAYKQNKPYPRRGKEFRIQPEQYTVSQITINRPFMPRDVSKLLNSTPVMFRNRNYKQSKAQGHSRTA